METAERQHAKRIEQTLASINKNLERIAKSLEKMEPIYLTKLTAEEGIEIEVSKDVQNNTDPAEAKNDDHIRFGDVVGFKTCAGDVTTGIVIDIRDGKAAILYRSIYDDHFDIAYNLLGDLRRLKITYSEITEDITDWLAN